MLTKPVLIKLINLGAIQTLIDLQQLKSSALQAVGLNAKQIQLYHYTVRQQHPMRQSIYTLSLPNIGDRQLPNIESCIQSLSNIEQN